jgi:general transcriptional corepressor CYC8
VPQDVHPQAYQNGVGVPPGPQWGGSAASNQQSQQPPVDPARVSDWTRGIAAINPPPGQQQQQHNGYDGRDSMRAPPLRAPSPRQDGPRPYDSSRQTPVSRKMQSPSPKMQPAGPGMFPPGPQTLPQISMQERPPAFGAGVRPSPTMNGPPPPHANGGGSGSTLPPYGRPFSPPNELRPLRDERPPSPGAGYRPPPFQSGQPFPSMANGGPSAATPLPPVEGPPRDDRPPSAMKRSREWEQDGGPSKKLANEESRARLDEIGRRNSPPGRLPTPKDHFRRSSSEARREQERRANENYHPSEAAHHPYSHPQQIPSVSSILDGGARDERKEPVEQAARKVEVDEDYDNNSEDDKQRGLPPPAASSPQVAGPPPSATPKQEAAP